MNSIQALVSMVASMQLTSGRQHTGGHSRSGEPQRIQAQVARQVGFQAPLPRPQTDGVVVRIYIYLDSE